MVYSECRLYQRWVVYVKAVCEKTGAASRMQVYGVGIPVRDAGSCRCW